MAARTAAGLIVSGAVSHAGTRAACRLLVDQTARRSLHASSVAAQVPPRTTLPQQNLVLGPSQLNRFQEHYHTTLAEDLLYMTYEHGSPSGSAVTPTTSTASFPDSANPSSNQDPNNDDRIRRWDPSSPYAKSRPARPARGNRRLQPLAKPLVSPGRDLVRLEGITLTAFCKEAITNKHALVPLVAQLRAITGLNPLGSHADPTAGTNGRGHIEIIKAKSGVASFKLRPGMPVGVKAVLPPPVAHEFLEVLVTFVLPRLRSFAGVPLPPVSQPHMSPAALSGVVSFGLGPEAMALFPQVEVNFDQYPNRGVGFQVSAV